MSVSPNRFEEFFRAVYEFPPFPWQIRLAKRVTAQRRTDGQQAWPECLALPTGSGKTACIDVAIFALACHAGKVPDAPRRIIFVVDRRVIVDQAFLQARRLAEKLRDAQRGILKETADALREIAGQSQFRDINNCLAGGVPLTCHQLRGGVYRDDAWARTPTQPCIIASTVDQVGSRILFRGYGQSNKNWPLHAGLAGNDSLILLDEAHCSNPFFQTMQWISQYRGPQWAESPLLRPFQFVVMSATPPFSVTDVMREDSADWSHPVLRPRLKSSKPASLIVCGGARGKRALEELAVEMACRAAELVNEQRRTVAIFVNRVETARLVDRMLSTVNGETSDCNQKIIRKLRGCLPDQFDHVLMTGRMRPVDRDRVTTQWKERLQAKPSGDCDESHVSSSARPVFVTATQCLEVGADYDFDAIVTECASLDALRQRFGRLNRVGRKTAAAGTIVIRQDQTSAATVDPVYEGTLIATWSWLNEHALANDEAGRPTVDFGVARMNELWDQTNPDVRSTLTLQGSNAPVMLPAYVDRWVQTSPEPRPTPDVSLFLHGPREGPAEVQVCWRADIPLTVLTDLERPIEERQTLFIEAVSLCPPTSRECMPVPFYLFRQWLAERLGIEPAAQELSDTDSTPPELDDTLQVAKSGLTLVWRGPDESRLVWDADDLRPGDTVVIPRELRGWDVFGHIPATSPCDVADECYLGARRRAVLRLQPGLLRDWFSDNPICEELVRLIEVPEEEFEWAPVSDLLNQLVSSESARPERVSLATILRFEGELRKGRIAPHPFGGYVLRTKRLKIDDSDLNDVSPDETITTEDESSSFIEDARPIPLAEHCKGVAAHARVFAEICGLPPRLVHTLELAGQYHDIGKADQRFQAMLHAGHRLRAQMAIAVYAKSQGLPVTPIERRRAWKLSALPDGFRHEFVSLSIVESLPELIPNGSAADRDLVLHLIAGHHGHGRPFAPVVLDTFELDEDIFEIDLSKSKVGIDRTVQAAERRSWTPAHRFDSDVSERFWKLVRRYGWWGIAWLEAIFILADHRQSEWESHLFHERQVAQEEASP